MSYSSLVPVFVLFWLIVCHCFLC